VLAALLILPPILPVRMIPAQILADVFLAYPWHPTQRDGSIFSVSPLRRHGSNQKLTI